MPKIIHTFCCCIRPHSSAQKNKELSEREVDRNVASIITQVNPKDQQKQQQNAAGTMPLQKAKDGDNFTATNTTVDRLNASIPQRDLRVQKDALLPKRLSQDHKKKCLIVDLDETLVHSSFRPVKNADFVIPVEIDNVVHQVYVLKRPYADEFLERVGKLFECVLFTASLAKYADPVADLLDKKGTFRSRLFREACVFFEGNYVKDLDRLGRELHNVIIIDNSPASYAFHPGNAIPVRTWFDDPTDRELMEILPLLETLANPKLDVYTVLNYSNVSALQQRSTAPARTTLPATRVFTNSEAADVDELLNATGSSPIHQINNNQESNNNSMTVPSRTANSSTTISINNPVTVTSPLSGVTTTAPMRRNFNNNRSSSNNMAGNPNDILSCGQQ